MSKRSAGRSVGPVKRVEGKTERVTVSLPPALAHRLKLFALDQGYDLGDVVASAVTPLLAGFTVSYRASGGSSVVESSSAPDSSDSGLRAVG